MPARTTLRSHLDQSAAQSQEAAAIADIVAALAEAGIALAALIADGPLAGITGAEGGTNPDGDAQKDIDVAADALMRGALRRPSVAAILSEEQALPEMGAAEAPFCVALDPLDGSANLANNLSVGTIFSIRRRGRDAISTFFEPGTSQCCAGFVVYGPQTSLVLALDQRVDIFVLDRRAAEFVLTASSVRIAADTPEFAINASNRRHWTPTVRAYIDDCLIGTKGDKPADYNMRWIGSLVAEAYRLLARGGVFLYPADARDGYREGRLRLLYEAHPMALVMEWAGGAAITGRARILEISARALHQRVPLIMGAKKAVDEIALLHENADPKFENSDAPLFARRGLFR